MSHNNSSKNEDEQPKYPLTGDQVLQIVIDVGLKTGNIRGVVSSKDSTGETTIKLNMNGQDEESK